MANIYQGVGNPREYDQVNYGNGQVGTKNANGTWSYTFDPSHQFQDVLGDNELQNQMQLFQFRQQNPVGVAADDTGANAQMSGAAPLKNATPAQQWNAQPAAAPAAPVSGTQSALLQELMQRAQQGPATINDPTVRAQIDPQVAALERSSRNYLDQQAEQAGPLANLQGEQRLAAERTGQQAAGITGEVLGRVQSQRAQEIQDALSQWGSLLSDQDRMALQKELSQLQLAQQGSQFTASQAQNQDQFLRELALREALQNNNIDLGWASLGL